MIITRTPFRFPLGGGGTDLPSYYREYGGLLITAAINKYMYISLNEPAIGKGIKINYSRVEIVSPDQIEEIQHDIVRECLKYLDIRRPLEISSMADIPARTGLGSSSSYAVGLLNCLNTLLRRQISTKDLAEEACKIEIELIGKTIGKVEIRPLLIDHESLINLEHSLLMFYTKIDRDANDVLNDQNQRLRQQNGPNQVTLQAMHQIKEIGQQIGQVLLAGDVEQFGELLHEHWLTKKKISDKMTNPDIDRWYELARTNGAIGGKIMGAGGGGFFLFCCKPEKRRQLRSTMEKEGLYYTPFDFDFEGSKVLTNF